MKRRKLLTTIIGGICLILVLATIPFMGACAPKEMEQTIWRVQTCCPESHFMNVYYQRMADEVLERTNGKLKIEVYPSGGLGLPLTETISSVRDGLLNMGQAIGAFSHGEFPLADVLEMGGLLPQDFDLRYEVSQAMVPYYNEILPKEYNQYLLTFYAGEYRNICTADRKVTTLDDLKGLKVRSSGPSEVSSSQVLGMSPVSIASPEIYGALQTGIVDGAWLSTSFYAAAKFWEVSKSVYEMYFGGQTFLWIVNKDSFEALPEDVQQIVREAATNATDWLVFEKMKTEYIEARKVCEENGMVFTDITDEDYAKLQALVKPIREQYAKDTGPLAQEMMGIAEKMIAEAS